MQTIKLRNRIWETEIERQNQSHIVKANCISSLDHDYIYSFKTYLSSNLGTQHWITDGDKL